MATGAIFKFREKLHRWKQAMLREASKDAEGYYLKVDGTNEKGQVEQLYLFLSEFDVKRVIRSWTIAVAQKENEETLEG